MLTRLMKSPLLRSFCYALLLLSLVLIIRPAYANTVDAKAYVTQIGDKTIAILADKSMPQATKEAKLTDLFTNVIDTDWIARFVLGRYWNTANPDQQKRYRAVYQKFLINSYVPNFRSYTSEKFTVTAVSQTSPQEYTVQTQIIHPDKPATRVDYRLIQVGNVYKVRDIIAEGVSLINTQRSDFGSVAENSGIEGLIKALQDKAAAPQ